MAKGPDLEYTQGDSGPITLRFKDSSGNAIDLTGYTDLFLTTDPSDSPSDGSNNIDSMPGTIRSPETGGIVDFYPSGADETAKRSTSEGYPVSDAYYDVQAINDSGNRTTMLDAGSKFKIKAQINHS